MEALASLDIRSNHLVAAVTELTSSFNLNALEEFREGPIQRADLKLNEFKIAATGIMGFRKGFISDPAAFLSSLKEIIAKVEELSGSKISSLCIGIPGHTVELYRKNYHCNILKRRVSQNDVERLIRRGLDSASPIGQKIIHVIPTAYYADGIPVDGSPLGLNCTRLEAEAILVTADKQLVEQLIGLVESIGLKVAAVIPSTLASGELLLNNVQKKLGIVLIDIGGPSTNVVVYNHGFPVSFDTIPVGSDHITSDMAICLRTTLPGAEEVKLNIGLCSVENDYGMTGIPQKVTVPRISGSGYNQVPVNIAAKVVEARITELLELISASVIKQNGSLDITGGYVLTGGGSRLKGLIPFIKEYLGVEAKLGSTGLPQEAHHETINIAGAVGLLKHLLLDTYKAEELQYDGMLSRLKKIFSGSG